MTRTFNADVCTAITKSNSHRFYSANLYIPDQVECIASEVFQKKRELSTVRFPASLKNIGARAFQGCSALSSVDLPQQVEDIGPGVFSQCSSLEKVSLSRAISSVPKAAFRGELPHEKCFVFHGFQDFHNPLGSIFSMFISDVSRPS